MPERRRRASSPARRVYGRRLRRRPGVAAAAETAPEVAAPASARSRLAASLTRPRRGQVVAAVFVFLIGLAGVIQVRAGSADDTYASARREDLVGLLDGLSAESERLTDEVADLERTRVELESGADRQRVARTLAQGRADDLAILAGTAPARGPGIRITIDDPGGRVTGAVVLDAVEELRDAGAEVIEVNDTLRVVASTWFGTQGSTVLVDGQPVSRPIVLDVIGDPGNLAEGAEFRGGLVSEITGPAVGGEVRIERLDDVTVESLHSLPSNQYAQPASAPPTPR